MLELVGSFLVGKNAKEVKILKLTTCQNVQNARSNFRNLRGQTTSQAASLLSSSELSQAQLGTYSQQTIRTDSNSQRLKLSESSRDKIK